MIADKIDILCPFCQRQLNSYSGLVWWCLDTKCEEVEYNSEYKLWYFNKAEYTQVEFERLLALKVFW